MRSTQLPHLVALEGFITTSNNAIPAPLISPLIGGQQDPLAYLEQARTIADALNGKKKPEHVTMQIFETLSDFAIQMRQMIDESSPQALAF
jgi:CRISPR-associated protein Cst2